MLKQIVPSSFLGLFLVTSAVAAPQSDFDRLAERLAQAAPVDLDAWQRSFDHNRRFLGEAQYWNLTSIVSKTQGTQPGETGHCPAHELRIGYGLSPVRVADNRFMTVQGLGMISTTWSPMFTAEGAPNGCLATMRGQADRLVGIVAELVGKDQLYASFEHELHDLSYRDGFIQTPPFEPAGGKLASSHYGYWKYLCRALEADERGPSELLCSVKYVIAKKARRYFSPEAVAGSGVVSHYVTFKKK